MFYWLISGFTDSCQVIVFYWFKSCLLIYVMFYLFLLFSTNYIMTFELCHFLPIYFMLYWFMWCNLISFLVLLMAYKPLIVFYLLPSHQVLSNYRKEKMKNNITTLLVQGSTCNMPLFFPAWYICFILQQKSVNESRQWCLLKVLTMGVHVHCTVL